MGSYLSQAKLTSPPADIHQLNDSVYELKHHENPDVEVIFFHGLQPLSYKDAYWRTWLSRDGTVVWPQTWLAEDLPNARILTIKYDSVAVRGSSGGQLPPYLITENLIQDIVRDTLYAAGRNCPVVLVGHSLGGMIIKQFLLHLNDQNDERARAFLSNCSGVFYYSTPQGGSDLTKFLDWSPWAMFNNPIVDLLRVLGKEPSRINDRFSRVRRLLNIKTAAMFETYETRFLIFFSRMVVTEAANNMDLDEFYSSAANHYDVCKPEEKQIDPIFRRLVNFVQTSINRNSDPDNLT